MIIIIILYARDYVVGTWEAQFSDINGG